MRRKTNTLPPRAFRYGCLGPTVNADIVEGQLRLAQLYRNKLIEIELARRAAVRQVHAGVPEIADLQSRIDLVLNERAELRGALKAARMAARRRAGVASGTVDRLKVLEAELVRARGELRTAKQA